MKKTGNQRGALACTWEDERQKNWYSLFFSEADLVYFELLSASHAAYDGTHTSVEIFADAITVAFIEVALYRGTEVIGTFEMNQTC